MEDRMPRRRSLARIVSYVAMGSTFALAVPTASAQVAVSSNDNKVVMDNGVIKVVKNPPPDTVSIIDLKTSPPKVIGEVKAPSSVIGPPLNVAVTPDETLALVTASMKVDPADPTKQAPDSRLSVIDLSVSPPKVIAELEAGKSPAGLSINRQGTLALVANRGDGTVSVFGISGKTVTPLGKVTLGDDKIGVSHVAISPDGKTALATRDGDHMISVLSIEGNKVEYTKRDMMAGLKPYAIDISADGAIAVVGNDGRGNGDADTISVVDLKASPPRVVETLTVGQTPEGVLFSPDGKLCAVTVMNGSNKPRESPFYANSAKLLLYRVEGTRLVPAAAAWLGHWPQGIAFSADGRTILAQNMVEKEIWVLRWDGTTLKDSGQRIKTNGGPCGIRTAPPRR
jgi:DNA-binding beta-propeller fold protein YncE